MSLQQKNRYTIYSISDPRNGVVFYIGMTVCLLSTRAKAHIRKEKVNSKKNLVIKSILNAGLNPEFKVLTKVWCYSSSVCSKIEKTYILRGINNRLDMTNRCHIKQIVTNKKNGMFNSRLLPAMKIVHAIERKICGIETPVALKIKKQIEQGVPYLDIVEDLKPIADDNLAFIIGNRLTNQIISL